MGTFSPENLLLQLNGPTKEERLDTLKRLAADPAAAASLPPRGEEVNNHVHTMYSFSPYSPSAVLWFGRRAGLSALGSMDHDSIGAAEEFLAGGKILGVATTVGVEIRVSFVGTSLKGRKLNNPDSRNILYMTLHGIPEDQIGRTAAFLKPLQEARNRRNRKQVDELNTLIRPLGIDALDFERDVSGRSRAAEGGSITERHILAALCRKIMEKTGKGRALVSFLEESLKLRVSGSIKAYLLDRDNPHYLYDLLGILKGHFLPRFFIQPGEDECPSVYEAVRFGNEIGAIPCYAYLGDVGESPTGDKKAENFEDDILEELLPELKRIGFKGVTYMPPRNTLEQLERVRTLCAACGLMEISGVDINSSRQSFNCPEILRPDFAHLIKAAWALIAHEKLAARDPRYGLFHPDNPLADLPLADRVARYGLWGRGMDPYRPEELADSLGDLS